MWFPCCLCCGIPTFPTTTSSEKTFWKVENESRFVLASVTLKDHRHWEKHPGLHQSWRGRNPGRTAGQNLRAGRTEKESNKEPAKHQKVTLQSLFQETCGLLSGIPYVLPYLLGVPSLPGQLSYPLPPPYIPSTECENKGPVILTPFKGEETAKDRAWWFIEVHIDSVGLMVNGYSGRNMDRSPPSIEEHSGTHQRPS